MTKNGILLVILILLMGVMPCLAQGYDILVIPYSAINANSKNTQGGVDLEEMFARKVINQLERGGMANAPEVNVLKVSIKNNSKYDPSKDLMENIKVMAKAYGVNKVIVVCSKTDFINDSKQQNLWEKLDLPVITQPNSNMQIVTRVTMYNAREDEIAWSDVYYKHLDATAENIQNKEKLMAVNSYYDDLIPKMFSNIIATKETHAIMLTSEPDEDDFADENPVVSFIENLKKSMAERQAKKFMENEKKEKLAKSAVKPEAKKPVPDLSFQGDKEDAKKVSIFEKIMKTFQFKFYVVKQDLKLDNIKSELGIKEKDKGQKTAEKMLKAKQKDAVKTSKEKIKKEEKTAKSQNLIETIKQKYTASEKSKKVTVKEDKTKFLNLYSQDNENSSANTYIQIKPRYNSKNHVPRFDNSVNDI